MTLILVHRHDPDRYEKCKLDKCGNNEHMIFVSDTILADRLRCAYDKLNAISDEIDDLEAMKEAWEKDDPITVEQKENPL